MKVQRRKCLAVAALVVAACGLSVSSATGSDEEDKACFSQYSLGQLPAELTAKTDELVRHLIGEGASSMTVYLLTRQMVIIGHMERRILARDPGCASAVDGLGRDYEVLKRNFTAFAEGDAQFQIEKVKSPTAQGMLKDIAPLVAELGEKWESLRAGANASP